MTDDAALVHALTPERMSTYERHAHDAGGTALQLYRWNLAVASGLHGPLHYVEVGLRNALDRALSAWNAALGGEGEWWDNQCIRLSPRARRRVSDALRAATDEHRKPVVHGKVVAELSFGFWVALLADEYNRTLWAPCLRHAFEGNVRRRTLHSQVDELRRLRNRIAHHEPLLARDLAADHASIIDVAQRVAKALGREVRATSILPTVLDQRPSGARSGSSSSPVYGV